MRMKFPFICFFIVLLIFVTAEAEIEPFDFSFAVPLSTDMKKEEAEEIADNYFQKHGDRVLLYQEDITSYEKVTSFIRVAHDNEPTYCWVVAYNDGKFMNYYYGFAGIVIISSPDARVIAFSDESYLQAFKNWSLPDVSDPLANVVTNGMLDLLVLPNENRMKHILPDMNVIKGEEALKIADRLVAGYQQVAEHDVYCMYDINARLCRDLAVLDYPTWIFQYCRFKDICTEIPVIDHLEYVIALYAHTGNVWYVVDVENKKAIYVDNSFCNLPVKEEELEPGDWESLYYCYLFENN